MREMRLHKREIRDLSVIKEILEECQVVRLGLTDEDVHRTCELWV